MAGIYDRLRATSARLLDRFDQEGTQTVIQSVMPNPDPMLPPAIIESPQSIKAVVRGVSAEIVASTPDLQVGDLQVITDYRFTPEVGGAVLINNHQRAILRVEPIPAAGDPVAYKFFVR